MEILIWSRSHLINFVYCFIPQPLIRIYVFMVQTIFQNLIIYCEKLYEKHFVQLKIHLTAFISFINHIYGQFMRKSMHITVFELLTLNHCE